MHFEFLVEDLSGKEMLQVLVPKVIGAEHSFKVHSYKGVGRIPKGMKATSDASKRILMDQLPRLLAGYGKAFASYGDDYPAAVIIVCDLDRRNRASFEKELRDVASTAELCPLHAFCIAIEEGEAWYLGDLLAIKSAYPKAKDAVLSKYVNDAICGTWELLADAVYPGGSAALSSLGWQSVGLEKSRWVQCITPHLVPLRNKSPSFKKFVSILTKFAEK